MAPLDDPMTLKGQTQAWLLLGLMLTACTMDDERDECCTDGSVVDFRYYYNRADRFDTYISTMQYYLFDGEDGHYLGEMYGEDDDISVVSLDGLWNGSYSLVAIGNLVDYGTVEGLEDGLDSLRLVVNQTYESTVSAGASTRATDTVFANGDRIYWGQCDFTYVEGANRTYTGEMSNNHCCLLVRVEWEHLPSYSSGYNYRLTGVGCEMEMTGANAATIDRYSFPTVTYEGDLMREDVSLRNFALQARLYTLRYATNNIPTFRLYHNDDPVTPAIDLSEVFSEWSWSVAKASVQNYEILITIYMNGTVRVTQNVEGYIADWTDGGTLG